MTALVVGIQFFVPVTVGSFADFEARFGGIDPDRFGPYAVKEYLKYNRYQDVFGHYLILSEDCLLFLLIFEHRNGIPEWLKFLIKAENHTQLKYRKYSTDRMLLSN